MEFARPASCEHVNQVDDFEEPATTRSATVSDRVTKATMEQIRLVNLRDWSDLGDLEEAPDIVDCEGTWFTIQHQIVDGVLVQRFIVGGLKPYD